MLPPPTAFTRTAVGRALCTYCVTKCIVYRYENVFYTNAKMIGWFTWRQYRSLPMINREQGHRIMTMKNECKMYQIYDGWENTPVLVLASNIMHFPR